MRVFIRRVFVGLTLAAVLAGAAPAAPPKRFALPGADGRLTYATDARGNRVPDFSFAGYGGGAAIPDVPVVVTVPVVKGDSTARVQAAVCDFVPGKPFSTDNYRSLTVDSVCSINGLARLGIHPQSLTAMLPRFLGNQGVAGRYSRYRQSASR